MKTEVELSAICTKAVVKGKGRDQSAERGSVHDEEYRAENRALRNTQARPHPLANMTRYDMKSCFSPILPRLATKFQADAAFVGKSNEKTRTHQEMR